MTHHRAQRTYIGPSSGTLLELGPDQAHLYHAVSDRVTELDGALVTELRGWLEGGPLSPRLDSLAALFPDSGLRELLEDHPQSSSPAIALGLSGFDTLFVEIIGRCNERCIHCYAESTPQTDGALTLDAVGGIINSAADLGFSRIQFTGGEPLLHRELPAMLARARRENFDELEIYTNATLLSDALLASLRPHRPCFAVTFFSHDSDTHDRLTGLPGSQHKTLEAIDRVLKAGLDLRVSIVSLPDNAPHIEQAVAFLEDRGVERIAWSGSSQVGRGGHHPSPPVRSKGGAHRGESTGHGGSLAVTYRGEVIPCIFNRQRVLGSVADASLQEIVRAPASSPTPTLPAHRRLSCPSCRLTDRALEAGSRGPGL